MTNADRIADLSALWKQASLIFPYFDRGGVDWDGAYRAYLPKVLAAETEREFHLLLAEFMNLLGDGHTDYLLPRALQDETGYLPFALRYIRGGYFIDGAHPACADFVGAQLVRVNGVPFGQHIAEVKRYSYHVGDYVSRYKLHRMLPFFLKPTGNRAETTRGSFAFDLLPANPGDFAPKALSLPEAYRTVQKGKPDIRVYGGGILCVRMDDFLDREAADKVRAAICENPDIRGVLFDLRENIGGMTMYGAKVAELFCSGVFHGCQKRTRSMTGVALASASQIARWSEEAVERHIAAGLSTREEMEESRRFVTNTHFDEYVDTYGGEGHTALFSGPCAILTSRHTVSAAEDFVAMFRSNRRATVIGTETCGTTGTPYLQQLSCGGSMRVCSVGYRLLDGTEFVGCGIRPDVFCEISPEDYERGYDAVLKSGLDHLRGE